MADPEDYEKWKAQRKADIQHIREQIPSLACLDDRRLGQLYSWYSEETMAAGWLSFSSQTLANFEQWALTSPLEKQIQRMAAGEK